MSPDATSGGTTDGTGEHARVLERRLDDLRDEHGGWFPSCDVCSRCGDVYCDGIGCIADIDVDDENDHDRLEEVQDLMRNGKAWGFLIALRDAGRSPADALALAEYALAYANNQPLPDITTLPIEPARSAGHDG